MAAVSSEYTIEKANLTEAEDISRLVNSVYRGESSKIGWTTEADLLGGQRTDSEEIQELILQHTILCLKQKNAPGKILACVLLERKDTFAYLGMLSVSAELQGQNIGKNLIAAAEKWTLTHWNLNQIKITVIAQRPELIAWYERRGFVPTGEQEPFPMDQPRFGLPRRNDLYFIIMKKNF